MDGAPTVLLDLSGDEAARALIAGHIDAAFLMGDAATPEVMRSLRELPGIELLTFRQADGYLRKFRFLSKLTLPEGAMDLGKDYPPRTLELIGPTVELVARRDLHPALSDLLISAAREVHGGAGPVPQRGRVPGARWRATFRSAPTPSATTSPASSSSTSGCRSGWPASSIGCWSCCCRCWW